MQKLFKISNSINTIFVDCFDTIILRKTSKKEIFKQWSNLVEKELKIPAKEFYKVYKNSNFLLCTKKIFTSFALQEKFERVLNKMYSKLSKKYKKLNMLDFVSTTKGLYFQAEAKQHFVNEEFIDFLREEKAKGKKIYMVSDFYCSSDTIKKWLENLNVLNLFDDVFSSSDYDKEKSSTRLYKYLLKQLNLQPQKVVMCGDNLWSDSLMAKMCKIQTLRINYGKQQKNNNK